MLRQRQRRPISNVITTHANWNATTPSSCSNNEYTDNLATSFKDKHQPSLTNIFRCKLYAIKRQLHSGRDTVTEQPQTIGLHNGTYTRC